MSSPHSELATNLLISSNQNFSANMYKALNDEYIGDNMFISPLSIHLILILTWLGCRGRTADELKAGLYLPSDENGILDSIQKLVTDLEKPQLHSATEIFIDQRFLVKEDFVDKGRKYFKSSSQLVPFQSDPGSAVSVINNYVANKTNYKIREMLTPLDVDTLTKLVLINAIHFKDTWKIPFPARLSIHQSFHVSKQKTVTVSFMSLFGEHFNFYRGDTYKALELPYEGDVFRMLILLPNEVDGLPALESKMQTISIAELTQRMTSQKITVQIPKFKLELSYDLRKILNKLGMTTIFTDAADLSGINDQIPLAVTKVLHKSFIEVNEEGTEASAGTAVIIAPGSAPVLNDFIADHPFAFFIVRNNLIVFQGRVINVQQ